MWETYSALEMKSACLPDLGLYKVKVNIPEYKFTGYAMKWKYKI
jgi:hypothetical protein